MIKGIGVVRDLKEAMRYYKLVVDNGDTIVQKDFDRCLALCRKDGIDMQPSSSAGFLLSTLFAPAPSGCDKDQKDQIDRPQTAAPSPN